MRLAILLLVASCARSGHVERAVEAPVPVPEIPSEASEAYRRGAQLYRTASCVGCHSPPFAEAEHLGGGRTERALFMRDPPAKFTRVHLILYLRQGEQGASTNPCMGRFVV